MGIRIKTDDYGIRVWRDDKYGYPSYSVSIQAKKDDGGYVTEYKQVKFRKGVELENGSEIIIRDAFPTLDVWKDKQTGEFKKKEVWVILSFAYMATAGPQTQRERKPVSRGTSAYPEQVSHIAGKSADYMAIDDLPDSFAAAEDDIPF